MERITTFHPQLDEIVGGGLPTPSLICLYGPPVADKSSFLMWLLSRQADNDSKTYYFCTDFSEAEVNTFLERLKIKKKENFNLVDLWSWRTHQHSVSVTDLPRIVMDLYGVVSKAGEEKVSLIGFDSITTISFFNPHRALYSALERIKGVVAESNISVVFTMDENTLEPQFENSLLRLFHGVLHFSVTDDGALYFKLPMMIHSKPKGRYNYSIDNEKLTISDFVVAQTA